MDFRDYYKILDIPQSATLSEIKTAFKKQTIKWHPDKNSGMDTTIKMQEINEAYLILKDTEARRRYDLVYTEFKTSNTQKESRYSQKEKYKEDFNTKKDKQTESQSEYDFDDEILKNWMRNARRQSVDLAIQTIKEMGKLSITASKAAGSTMLIWLLGYVISGLILFLLFKTCSGI